jgi:hypothetical protein
MSLSYCLCKFVIISEVSISKPNYRFTDIEQGGKYMSSWGGAKRGVIYLCMMLVLCLFYMILSKVKLAAFLDKDFYASEL